jgi:hypothetical protein
MQERTLCELMHTHRLILLALTAGWNNFNTAHYERVQWSSASLLFSWLVRLSATDQATGSKRARQQQGA